MGDVKVVRWSKYGHDRLYVKVVPGGVDLGWVDLKTGKEQLAPGCDQTRFRAAVVTYCSAHGIVAPGITGQPARTPDVATEAEEWLAARTLHGTVPLPPWRDLAMNVPGEQAQAQADAQRAAAPRRTFIARMLGIRTAETSWRVGAQGEQLVAQELQKLPLGWHVVHAVTVGSRGADIDHVVVGPGGVFTVNSKHHPRAKVWVGGNVFMINGQRHPYVRNARHEAQRASRLLSTASGFRVDVQGVIAVVGASSVRVKKQPDDVRVVTRRQLRPWLTRHPPVLTDDGVDHILTAARKSTTWMTS